MVNDTGESAEDKITEDATIQGTLPEGVGRILIEFDKDNNSTIDGMTFSDEEGNFSFLPLGVTAGAKNYSAWKAKSFPLQVPTNTVPVINSFTLWADTGASSTDNKIANDMLVGHVNNDQTGMPLIVEFDHNNDGIFGSGRLYRHLGEFSV